jgi:hypothetical protein
VDGRTIGDGTAGPVTKHLTQLYADLTTATGTVVVLATKLALWPTGANLLARWATAPAQAAGLAAIMGRVAPRLV